jgi:hypothetical protein
MVTFFGDRVDVLAHPPHPRPVGRPFETNNRAISQLAEGYDLDTRLSSHCRATLPLESRQGSAQRFLALARSLFLSVLFDLLSLHLRIYF